MPIRKYLGEPGIGPELAEAMTRAFDAVVASLRQSGVTRIPGQSIAKKVAQFAHDGIHDADALAKAVLDSLPKR